MIVRHHAGGYPLRITDLASALEVIDDASLVVTDDNVLRIYGDRLPKGARVATVRPGEASKSLDGYGSLVAQMAALGADRRTTVVAFGGGVVGDLAGFAAATFMRGLRLVQIPTTLLAQVDSSVGGKVGIDLPEGKNLLGAFYPPAEVRVPIDALATLDGRQINNGMAEVWKYAFIADPDLDPSAGSMEGVVRRCVEIKARIVEADEFERTGLRATLNFGHTVGHALERLTGYGPLLHGEAISIGMVAEARLGERLGVTPPGVADAVEEKLRSQGLPVDSELLAQHDALIQAMRSDKKATDGVLAFSLLTGMGGCKLVEGVRAEEVRAALTSI